jgi:hypothetical protein
VRKSERVFERVCERVFERERDFICFKRIFFVLQEKEREKCKDGRGAYKTLSP